MFVAQPALGLQIRQLEQDLQVTLLARHSRGVSPTKAGRMLYERACEILRQVDEAEREVVAAGRQEREGIVLGMTNGVMSLIGRDMAIRTRAELPAVNLSLIEELSAVLIDALEREQADIALAFDVHERPGLLRVPLLEDEVLLICAPAAAPAADPVQFADIIGMPLALPGSRDVIRRMLEETAKRLALTPNVTLDVASLGTIKRLVAQGDAATIMPYGSAVDEIESGLLVARRIANPTLRRTLYFARSLRRAPIQNEDALIDLLGTMLNVFLQRLGPLGTRLPALEGPLSAAVAAAEVRADSGGAEGA